MATFTARIGSITGSVALAMFGLVAAAGSVGAADPVSEPVTFQYTGELQSYTVPEDGSVCAVTVDAVGANGGAGDFVDGIPFAYGNDGVDAQFLGGTGGGASSTFLVAPGDVISVLVGGVGGPGGGGSQDGGFGGGGTGGNGDGGIDGGGGGGASGFVLDSQPLLLAGGGGGGGAVVLDGGSGGSAGGDGGTGPTGPTGSGGPGGGGTATAGGVGGSAASGTPGAPGNLFSGGAGGNNGGALAGGGGGGGGGWFGGGGGGGADAGWSGGGGGGGSSFIGASVGPITAGSLTQDADGNGAAEITPLGPVCNVLTVAKTVQGVAPEGTQFTAHVECTTGESADVVYDASGAPVTADQVLVDAGGRCTVTETDTGGAVSTSYACTTTSSPSPCLPEWQVVSFGSDTSQDATVTITNLFPAPVEVITPRFTG